ncbi:MAG: DUF4159 domain-containing protein [Candidatus Latescibacteria bacterium]|nr:DUF4159 domain-containing protein [Candidatus Latescibacterota bacterium]
MPSPGERVSRRIFWISLLISLVLHLGGIGLLEFVWWGVQDERLVKVRLVQPPRMKPVRLEVVPMAGGQAEPLTRMERLAPEAAGPRQLSETQLPMGGEAGGGAGFGERGPALSPEGSVLALGGGGPGGRGAGSFAAPGERGPVLGGLVRPGSGRDADRTFDLLRLQDMARANKDHAAVIPNLASRRDLKGYINITRVRGVGFGSGPIDELARYMTDYTQVLVQAQPGYYDYFLNEQLLKDPVHFFFPGGLKRLTPYPLTRMSEEEIALLGRYLRGGGFLFIEGGRNFLNEMIAYLKQALKGEGRLLLLPLSHPLYTAYYNFSGGFPGEDKREMKEFAGGDSWYFPGSLVRDVDPDAPPPPVSPTNPQAQQVEEPRPLGLWGLALKGQLVVVLSDLGIHDRWVSNTDPEQPSDDFIAYNLMAATNIVVYALTRQGGLTPKLPPPAWETLKPQTPLAERPGVSAGGEEEVVQEILDASLALVQTPLGRELEEGGVQVIVDGKYSLELLKGGLHGLVLHNLPAGAHWLELRYAGKSKQLDVDLKGGQVRTLTFGLNRFGFLTQLRLSQQEELMGVESWRINFGDLQIEEVYLGEDREQLE